MFRPPTARRTSAIALLATLFPLLLVPSAIAAAAEGVAADALAPGSWSVQFSVQPNLTLGSYSGSTLSLKRHLAGGKALRFGVSLDFGGSSDDFTDANADTFASNSRVGIEDRNRWSVGAGVYYLWYTQRAAPVHGFWGVGPVASWSRTHIERGYVETLTSVGQPPQTTMTVDDITSRDWRVGVAGTAGVEWLVARRVGLFAEYGSALNYRSSITTRHATYESPSAAPRTSDSNRDSRGWDLSGSGGRLGVSVYY